MSRPRRGADDGAVPPAMTPIEYWIREGLGVETGTGIVTHPVDRACGC